MDYSDTMFEIIPSDLIKIIQYYRESVGIIQIMHRNDVHLHAMDCKRVHIECGILSYRNCDHCHVTHSSIKLDNKTFCNGCARNHYLQMIDSYNWKYMGCSDAFYNKMRVADLDSHGFRKKEIDGGYTYPKLLSQKSHCVLCITNGECILNMCIFCGSNKDLLKVYHWSMDKKFDFKKSGYSAGIIYHNICESCITDHQELPAFRKELTYISNDESEKIESCIVDDYKLCYFQSNY